jgi:hypothetical protein
LHKATTLHIAEVIVDASRELSRVIINPCNGFSAGVKGICASGTSITWAKSTDVNSIKMPVGIVKCINKYSDTSDIPGTLKLQMAYNITHLVMDST